MKTRPPRRSSPAFPAPTSRRCCSPSAAIATRCNGRCRPRAPRKAGSRSSRRWRAAPPSATRPGTYAFSQKQFIEPLADYLVSIRGPGSSDDIPFKQRPRPTDAASTNLVVTEYALPRGGERELYMLRGDRRFVWPHDVIMNDKYAYYTDHFSYVLGRIDLKTGEGEGDAVPGATQAPDATRDAAKATAARASPAAARTSCNSTARAMSSSAWTTAPSNTIRRTASSSNGRPAAPCSGWIPRAMSGICSGTAPS